MIILLALALQSTPAWTRWETSLTSSKTYANPYADVTVTVSYTGPSSFSAPAFWDGGSTFKLRCAFPAAGTWTWRTSCSDTSNAGLHNRSGSVSVVAYAGANVLYQKGFLKVSADRRHLAFNDGTPFRWIGDTAWIAPLRASTSDWQTYLNDRAAKRFTLIQISPASAWGGTADVDGNAPFTGSGLSKWNPAYWQGVEQKVEAANQKGLVVFMNGIMEPVSRYPTSSEAALFARNIAARLYGNFVIFSPSFDSPYKTLGDDVGNALNAATSRHLVTQHPGTDIVASRTYYDKGYLDFSGVQSGHNGGNRETCANRAITWNLEMYSRNPWKPVVNQEAFYDANGTVPTLGGAYQGTAKDARQLGWLSWLSGSLGYTYGAYGLWNWERDSSKAYHWSKATAYPSSTHMRHMSDFLGSIAWWRLAPAHSLVLNNPSAYLSKRVIAKSSNGDLAVAYIPDANPITLSMTSFSGTMRTRWFNPTSGAYTEAGSFANTGTRTFMPPSGSDWVLLFTPGTSGSLAITYVSSGRPYSLAPLAVGGLYYVDRSYSVTSTSLSGTLVRTANDDKNLTTSTHLTLSLPGTSTVYVAMDKRATSTPAWLSGWTLTTQTLAVSDAPASPLRVYSRSFPAGPVTLGGNQPSGAGSHYVAVVGGASSVAKLAEDVWEHEGDTDGDGLRDDFEAAHFMDPLAADSDGDGTPDEAELDAAGKTLWEVQASPAPAEDASSSTCGLLGAEFLLLGLARRIGAWRGSRSSR